MQYREETGVVIAVHDGSATVRLNRRNPATCGSCCSCAAGGGPSTVHVPADPDGTGAELAPGERVIARMPTISAYATMGLVFGLPMLLFVAGLLAGHAFDPGDEFGAAAVLFGIGGFLFAYGVAWFVNRSVSRRAPTSVRRAPAGEACSGTTRDDGPTVR